MTSFENMYVTSIYDKIANDFSSTRQYPWPITKTFIDNIEPNRSVLDAGSGNGINQYRKDINWSSCDSSISMCQIVNNCIVANVTKLPYKNDIFDNVICMAVIHHLENEDRRNTALSELIRVLKPGGTGLISVWASQPKYGEGDQFVKWKTKDVLRYYHFFNNEEILSMCNFFTKEIQFEIEFFNNNFYIKFTKLII